MPSRKSKKSHPKKKTEDPRKDQNVLIQSFKFLKKLGNGAQGEVYLVEKLDGVDAGTVYALKVFEKAKALGYEMGKQLINNELMALKKIVESPFLTTMVYALQSSNYLYIAMEFEQGGDLFSMFQKKPLTIFETKFVIAEVIMAIEQLHKHNILYRDLKLENILVDKNGHIVLSDFGLAYDTETTDPDHVVRLAGTIHYMPPEAMDAKLPYGLSFDWWTLGILTHELLTQKVPYKNLEAPELMKEEISKGDILIDEVITGDARDFIMKLLKKDVSSRLGSQNGATDLKKHQFFKEIDWDLMYAKMIESPFARTFMNKYDTSLFDEEYTETPINFQDESTNDEAKLLQDFFFIAPHLITNNHVSLKVADIKQENPIDITDELPTCANNDIVIDSVPSAQEPKKEKYHKKSQRTCRLFAAPFDNQLDRKDAIMISIKLKTKYIPNSERPSMIIKRCDYKK